MTEPKLLAAKSGVSSHCTNGACGNCDGTLHTATGWRWYCAHKCHPEPELQTGNRRAIEQFHADREAFHG